MSSPAIRKTSPGEPFVGPAGQLLRESLVEAGLDPEEVYLTNAVKHFKWEPRGKRRAPLVTLTVHPSPILRAPDSAARKLAREQFVADLKSIAHKLKRTE